MKALILCDRESLSYDGLNLPSKTQKTLEKLGNNVQIIELNGDETKPCIGCFSCWIKTPGLCAITSDCVNTVAGEEIQSDVILFLSKISYGGYSYDIKSFLDRSIPNISPFFEVVHGEFHHKMRYDHFPVMITLGYGICTPKERQTFLTLAERNALNMQTPKHYVFILEKVEDIDRVLESLENILYSEVPKCIK